MMTPWACRDCRARFDEVIEDGADACAWIVAKTGQDLGVGDDFGLGNKVEDSFPEGALLIGGAFFEALDLELVGAKGQAEHIGGHFAGNALVLDGAGKVEENLIGHMGERGADAGGRGELGDENRRLVDDGIDDKAGLHSGSLESKINETRLIVVDEGSGASEMNCTPWWG